MKPCPFCAEQIQLEAIKCRYCGELVNKNETSQDRRQNTSSNPAIFRRLGIGLILTGLATLLYFLSFYDTSVEVPVNEFTGGQRTRVNNLGLMQNRQNGIIVGGLLSLIGVLSTLAAPKSTQPGATTSISLKQAINANIKSIRKNLNIPDTRSNLDLFIYILISFAVVYGVIWAARTLEHLNRPQ